MNQPFQISILLLVLASVIVLCWYDKLEAQPDAVPPLIRSLSSSSSASTSSSTTKTTTTLWLEVYNEDNDSVVRSSFINMIMLRRIRQRRLLNEQTQKEEQEQEQKDQKLKEQKQVKAQHVPDGKSKSLPKQIMPKVDKTLTVVEEDTKEGNKDGSTGASSLDTDKSVLVTHTSLTKYLDVMTRFRHDIVLAQWDTSGTFQRVSSRKDQGHHRWLPDSVFTNYFQKTKKQQSQYGFALMIINTDVIPISFFTQIPPIQLYVYSIPYNVRSPMFQVMPNPYDLLGISETGVKNLQKLIHGNSTTTEKKNDNNEDNDNDKDNNVDVPISFEQFQQLPSVIVWRGKVRLQKIRKHILEMATDPTVNIGNWLDVADTSIIGSTNGLSQEIMSKNYKYQIDIGGVSGTAWNGLRWKLCASGGLVFKVDSYAKDWWYDNLVPWEHYIPVQEDLSDLRKNYEWAENNSKRSYEISLAGRDVCLQSYRGTDAGNTLIELIQEIPPISNQNLLSEVNQFFDEEQK